MKFIHQEYTKDLNKPNETYFSKVIYPQIGWIIDYDNLVDIIESSIGISYIVKTSDKLMKYCLIEPIYFYCYVESKIVYTYYFTNKPNLAGYIPTFTKVDGLDLFKITLK